MAPRALSAVALLAVLSPASAVQNKVAAHTVQQASTRSQVQRVEHILRSRTEQLKRALWDELGPVPEDYLTYDWADDARELLAQEADYLAAEDDYAASLLHNYARSPFVPLLGMAFEPPARAPPVFWDGFDSYQDEEEGDQEQELQEQVEASETTRRCRGRTCVLTTRTCSGRTCVTKETVEEPEDQVAVVPQAVFGGDMYKAIPEDEEWGMPMPLFQPEAAPEDDDFTVIPEEAAFGNGAAFPAGPVDATVVIPPEVTDAVGDAMRVAARGLAKGLKEAAKISGLPLGDMLGKVMNSTMAKVKDVAKTLSSGNASSSQMDIVISGDNMTKGFKDVMGAFMLGGFNISKAFAPGSILANAESVSTVTKVVDGKTVREIKRCKKGQCTTTTEEG